MQGWTLCAQKEAYWPYAENEGQYTNADFACLAERAAGEPGVSQCYEASAQSCQEVHGELIIFDAYLITLKEHRGLAMLFLVIHLT